MRTSAYDSLVECMLKVGRRSLTLRASLSPRSVVGVGNPHSHRRAFSRTWLLAGREQRSEGVLELGETTGDVLPPWAGDYAVESVAVGTRVLRSVLSGSDSAEDVLHEHRMRVRLRRTLLSGIESGGLTDVDLSGGLLAQRAPAITRRALGFKPLTKRMTASTFSRGVALALLITTTSAMGRLAVPGVLALLVSGLERVGHHYVDIKEENHLQGAHGP